MRAGKQRIPSIVFSCPRKLSDFQGTDPTYDSWRSRAPRIDQSVRMATELSNGLERVKRMCGAHSLVDRLRTLTSW